MTHSIRDAVAQALYDLEVEAPTDSPGPDEHWLNYSDEAHTAIVAFLEAAAERGWHMRPDEATQEMAHTANGFDYTSEYTMEQDGNLIGRYRTMLAAAPEFEVDDPPATTDRGEAHKGLLHLRYPG